jgi:hypothetical protein
VHRPEASKVSFSNTRSRALTASISARKGLPIAAGVVLAAVASAVLNRWMAKQADSLPRKVLASTTWSGEQERRCSCFMATEA